MLFRYRLRSMLSCAFAVLFYAFNTVVTFYSASYDPNIKVERYKKFLFRVEVLYYGFVLWFRIVVLHRDFVLWFRIVVSRRRCKYRRLFEIASTVIRDTR